MPELGAGRYPDLDALLRASDGPDGFGTVRCGALRVMVDLLADGRQPAAR